MQLEEIKEIGSTCGASTSAVLLAAVAGALRSYLKRRGQSIPGAVLHASIPVNLRAREPADELGNRFGLSLLELPIDRADAVERVTVLSRRLDELKTSAEAEVVHSLMNAYGIVPQAISSPAVPLIRKKVSAVVSSVPGPPGAIRFADKPINRMIFWVPQSGHLGLGLSLLTYKRSATLGVAADSGLVPDPESIARAFQDELEQLKLHIRTRSGKSESLKRQASHR